jgi:glycosyltransferase involved in cell wall biosynthesis
MRLVVITQRVDPADEALGATVAMLRALAARVDELSVLALVVRDHGLPANVRVQQLRGTTSAARGASLAASLGVELRRRGRTAVLAHMSPIYAVVAAPLARAHRAPLLLWFTHWRDSPLLRLALRASTRVLTVDRVSFPVDSPKVVPLGHAIDVDALRVPGPPDGEALRLLALGRTSPAKGLATIVDAVAALGDLPLTLDVRGPSLSAAEHEHRAELSRLVATRGLGERVAISEAVPRTRLAELLGGVHALVNNMRAGALDKVVFEAAAAARPVVVASPGFDTLVGGIDPPLRFRQDDAGDLAARIRALYDAGAARRGEIGRELRERVRAQHSVDHWADGVLEAAR